MVAQGQVYTGGNFMTGVWITLLVIVVILVVFGLRIVPQGHAYIIERLGKYADTWEA